LNSSSKPKQNALIIKSRDLYDIEIWRGEEEINAPFCKTT
jgi:hypothetical protein